MDITKILEKQAGVYRSILSERLKDTKSEADVYREHSTVFKNFYSNAFKPMVDNERVKDITSDKIEEVLAKISTDVEIAHDQINDISDKISALYNANQDYKTGLKNRTEYLSSLLSDVNIMIGEDDNNSMVFKDSLSNYNFIDKDFSGGRMVNISTSEGIAILAMENDENITEKAKEIKIGGNGDPGNYYVVKKVNIETANSEYDIYAKQKSDEDPKDNADHIIDSEPSTWFEYQKIGISDKDKTKYGIKWGNANKIREDLSLRITVELDKSSDINWIDITPYVPEKQNEGPIIYSVKLSMDGSQFINIYESDAEQSISIIPQNNLGDNLFDQIKSTKLLSQGILCFPKTKAKFIEIILKQTVPYHELLGTEYYRKTIKVDNEVIASQIVDKQLIPKAIIDGPPGIYKVE